MNDKYEDVVENLNLVYRLKEQAQALHNQSELMLRGVRAVLDAEHPEALYQRMFDNFSQIIPHTTCLILEPFNATHLRCSFSTLPEIVDQQWEIGEMLTKVIGGKTLAMYNVARHPTWQDVPLARDTRIKSLLMSPFIVKDELSVIVFAHEELGFYTDEHVQIAKRYREFTEQTLLSVNARLLAMASEQLKKEKEQVEQSLIASEKMASVGLLAAGVAHEINNPVGFVASNIDYLKTSVPTLIDFCKNLEGAFEKGSQADWAALQAQYEQHQIPQLLDDICDICEESEEGLIRVANITTSLKSFTRTDVGEQEHFCVNRAIEDTLPLVNPELKHHVSIELTLNDIPPVVGSARKLSQVLINLMMNAGQAICGQGVIRIETTRVTSALPAPGGFSDQVIIRIEDNGPGMSKQVREQIFQPFYTTKPPGEGTGLGLYISMNIVEAMGGHISVESEENRGTVFTIRLPVPHT